MSIICRWNCNGEKYGFSKETGYLELFTLNNTAEL
jgi:hypothetical protein